MSRELQFHIADKETFKQNLLALTQEFEPFCLLDSCGFYTYERMRLPLPYYHQYEVLAGLGAYQTLWPNNNNNFENLKAFADQREWKFGCLSYDLKNETESLDSQNHDDIEAPQMLFFIPRIVVSLQGNKGRVIGPNEGQAQYIKDRLLTEDPDPSPFQPRDSLNQLKPRITREAYTQKVSNLIEHIANGDIYEVNFCRENYAENADINPWLVFSKIRREAPAPFAAFMRSGEHYVMSASMERFLKHQNGKLISQPIKGTIGRGRDWREDREMKSLLKNDPKERAENVMIVDLVRNDLNKNSIPGTVQVEELFGIYPFPQVHQMISTISGKLKPGASPLQALKDAFPMGSMTGAPKLKAMELIEHYEETKRGIFSGSIGYIDPDGNFDFNVIIRTILFNEHKKHLSLQVGSAITFDADPVKEWEECELKISKLSQFV